MEAITLIGAVLGIVGALTSASVAAWVTLRGKRLDHEIERAKLWISTYEKPLFDNRLPGYKSLWALTEGASRENASRLSPEAAAILALKLTDWYYRDGGILLTAETRDTFFSARDCLSTYSPANLHSLVQAFSHLHTSMCDDLNSRRGPGFSVSSGRAGDPTSRTSTGLRRDRDV